MTTGASTCSSMYVIALGLRQFLVSFCPVFYELLEDCWIRDRITMCRGSGLNALPVFRYCIGT